MDVRVGRDRTLFDGIDELVSALSGRVPLTLATSKVMTLAEPLLRMLGLRDRFSAVAAPLPRWSAHRARSRGYWASDAGAGR